MAKLSNYTEELASWVKNRDKGKVRKDKNVVAFLALRPQIQEAIEAGYAVKVIWEHMVETGRITVRYETFLKHVKKYLLKEQTSELGNQASDKKVLLPTQATPGEQSAGKVIAVPESRQSAEASQQSQQIAGFSFNPKPDKKELF